MNPLPHLIRFQMIDISPLRSLLSSMRWMALFALVAFISTTPAFAQTSSKKQPKTPTKLPEATAEPENSGSYAPPKAHEEEPPSDADLGPVQKHFVIASKPDDPGSQENAETSSTSTHEKVALDKHIKVPLIHDVQNDSSYNGASNAALLAEIQYLNWGAVTAAQLKARQGHYFTITWSNGGSQGDFTTRFEYRQVNSKDVIRTLSQKMPHVSGTTRSYFAVVDKAYLAYGPVCSWRFTVLKGDTVVAETKSFIW